MSGVSINAYSYIKNMFSDPPYTTAYNVTISSSLTPADLRGFDIIISWTVSDDSACGGLLTCILTLFSVCDNSLSTRSQ